MSGIINLLSTNIIGKKQAKNMKRIIRGKKEQNHTNRNAFSPTFYLKAKTNVHLIYIAYFSDFYLLLSTYNYKKI